MFINYIKIAFRSIIKNKVYSFINLFGLALGIAIFMLATLYARHELSTDQFHEKHANLYQLKIGDEFITTAPLADLIKENIPDLESVIRIDDSYGGGKNPTLIINNGDNREIIKFKDVLFADHGMFDLFSFKALYGSFNNALRSPNSVVLTHKASLQLFGIENSVGKSIQYIGDRNGKPELDLTISAIIEDIPTNSSLSFNALVSFSTLQSVRPNLSTDWMNWGYKTYVQLNDKQVNSFQNKLTQLWLDHSNEMWPNEEFEQIAVIPLTDVSFHNNNKRQLVYFIQLIGLLILMMSTINYVNLTIAKSRSRTNEIGVRKAIGSTRTQLIKQFFTESILLVFMAAPLAAFLFETGKHLFSNIIEKSIEFSLFKESKIILLFFLVILVIGIIAAIYPANYLASFNPLASIKKQYNKTNTKQYFRYGFIIFQFSISAFLILFTIFVSKQIGYMRTKSLGFNEENVLHFKQSEQINLNYEVFKQELLKNPNVKSVSRSNHALGQELNISNSYLINGERKEYTATTIDPDFIKTMGIKLIEGRNFSFERKNDMYNSIIVNESFVKEMGVSNDAALGFNVDFINWKSQIIGVVKDFHNNSLHHKIEPSAFIYADWNSRINVRVNGKNMAQTIKYIEKTWNNLTPINSFEYEFLNSTYSALYKTEEKIQKAFSLFSLIAIVIACMGLIGLISYSTEQRIKEIGIRKVNGAKICELILLLNKNLISLVGISFTIAVPIAYNTLSKWLENFAYKTTLSWWLFAMSGILAVFIAIVTVSWQTFRAARRNPIEALRYE